MVSREGPWRLRRRVEHDAAAERVRRRDRAQHDAVAGHGHERLLEAHLPEAAAELGQPRRRLPRAVVDLHAVAVLGAAVGHEAQLGVEAEGRAQVGVGAGEEVPARDLVAADADEVDRDALPGRRALRGLVVDLDSAHARAPAGGQHRQLVAARDRARPQRPRHHRARALDREHAVDVQARAAAVGAAAGQRRGDVVQRRPHRVDPLAGAHRNRHDDRGQVFLCHTESAWQRA